MSASSNRTVTVDLGDRSYPIVIADGLLCDGELLRRLISGSQAMVVTNETIAPLYLDRVLDSLGDCQADAIVLEDGEQYKHVDTIGKIYDALLQKRHSRGTTLVALGGGVVGDMTGFAAATYQRGVSFLQLPTTLLAQVDSSVGGKTGVNHALGKNMIGAFHQPVGVVIDTETLETLPSREFRAGVAEVIKYGLIADPGFFEWLEANIDAVMQRDGAAITEAIARSCENKAAVVVSDEREAGVRAILNLGHTFGHALETATQYRTWLHGEAVGFGMMMALDLSRRLGLVDAASQQRGEALLERVGLPIGPPVGLAKGAEGVETILGLMGLDKKVVDGQLRLVLLRSLGSAFVTSDFDTAALKATLSDYLAREAFPVQ